MINLDPIKARLAAATPGPWRIHPSAPDRVEVDYGKGYCGLVYVDYAGEWDIDEGNAALIANAPTDLAALVAEVERLRQIELTHATCVGRIDVAHDRAERAEAEVERLKHPYRIAKCGCFLPTCLMCSEQDQ